jgi:hypothetical protein
MRGDEELTRSSRFVALTESMEPRPGFTDAVLASLPEPSPVPVLVVRTINGLMAAWVAFFAVALAADVGSLIEPGPAMFGVALIAGALGYSQQAGLPEQL